MHDPTTTGVTAGITNCLGRTCMKWGVDGDLTSLDLELVMERLARVDRDVAALRQDSLGREACASSS
jgi:hypothetical protein